MTEEREGILVISYGSRADAVIDAFNRSEKREHIKNDEEHEHDIHH